MQYGTFVLRFPPHRQAPNRYQQPQKILLTLIAGDLAQYHSARADFISKYNASKATVYSISKGKLSRLAKVASERLDEMQDPELSIDRAFSKRNYQWLLSRK